MVKATGRTDLEYKAIYLKKPNNIDKDFLKPILKPIVQICGDRNTKIFEELNVVAIHSSLSHEQDYAVAFVTLETEISSN